MSNIRYNIKLHLQVNLMSMNMNFDWHWSKSSTVLLLMILAVPFAQQLHINPDWVTYVENTQTLFLLFCFGFTLFSTFCGGLDRKSVV